MLTFVNKIVNFYKGLDAFIYYKGTREPLTLYCFLIKSSEFMILPVPRKKKIQHPNPVF